MLYQLRTGDVILCENKPLDQTNAYLIVYDTDNGFGLWCLGCGEALGFYGDDIEKMKTDILNKDFLNIQSVIPKELISEYLQIPLHRITDSASNGSVFPVVTEHFSASSDHAFL